mgnify:CR=1 FL=1|tara:strand:- start:742 stop:2064 length:1323 start_codon:yes stop_codon:yes gene_type:complete
MKFINLTNDFIEFLDNKSFYFNNDKLKLYNEKKEKKDKIFSSENTNKDLDKVLYKLYNDFEEASNYLLKKKENDEKIYDINIKNINHVHDIPKSVDLFESTFVPQNINNIINNESDYCISYKFKIKDRDILITFVACNENITFNIEKYNDYIDNIFIWFYIASKHAFKYCSKNLSVFIYLTNAKRFIPKSNVNILEPININGGVSNVCVKNSLSEIVIFRREEWFKVLIHETFHNYGLDFSDLIINSLKINFKKLFPIKSDMLIFEAYTEFWSEILNICFICYLTSINSKNNKKEKFIQLTRELMNIEKCFSLFQCSKVLHHMGLEYKDLFIKDKISNIKRINLYKEKTNVFPYYILKCILMYFCEDFLIWNDTHNTSLLRFNKTNSNLQSFYDFVEEKHNNEIFLQDIKKMEKYYINLLKSKKITSLKTTMRMSICEFY